MAAHAMHAQHDPKETTKNGCAANPSSLSWHEAKVDPDGILESAERRRRAEHHRKEHFYRLALASSKARRLAKGQT
jgi:hypothetical protein